MCVFVASIFISIIFKLFGLFLKWTTGKMRTTRTQWKKWDKNYVINNDKQNISSPAWFINRGCTYEFEHLVRILETRFLPSYDRNSMSAPCQSQMTILLYSSPSCEQKPLATHWIYYVVVSITLDPRIEILIEPYSNIRQDTWMDTLEASIVKNCFMCVWSRIRTVGYTYKSRKWNDVNWCVNHGLFHWYISYM